MSRSAAKRKEHWFLLIGLALAGWQAEPARAQGRLELAATAAELAGPAD